MRNALPLVLIAAFAGTAFSQDGLKPEKVAEIKSACVYVKTQIEPRKFTGSGFVVAADATALIVATNAHVVALEEYARLSPTEALVKLRAVKLSVVFDSGAATERTADAEIVGYDPTTDLALLKIKATDVKNPPKPLKLDADKKLSETSTVYTLGYPFGDALARGKGPAITVGKATISSLRTDDTGKLASIQIDGNLNPGNSGGPVIDSEGAVIGVAVAILRDSQGIGFAIPATEVRNVLAGKATMVKAEYKKEGTGVKVAVQALVSNTLGKLTGVEIDYAVVAADAPRPKADADVKKLPGAKTAVLKLDGPVAKDDLTLPAATGHFVYALRPVGGKDVTAGPLIVVSLGRATGSSSELDPNAKPPAEWKEIEMADKIVTIWVPEKSIKPLESTRTIRGTAATLYMTALQTKGDNGVIYRFERAVITPMRAAGVNAKLDTKAVRDSLVRSIVDEIGGKISEETDAKLGIFSGREYVIKSRDTTAIVRVAVLPQAIYLSQVRGPEAKVLGEDGSLFLNSFRLHLDEKPPTVVAKEPGPTTTPGTGTTTPPPMPNPGTGTTTPGSTTPTVPGAKVGQVAKILPEGETGIEAGVNDPVFRDYAPEGGNLIGFELGFGKLYARDAVTAIKPIYRTKDGEKDGNTQGKIVGSVTLKAKDGYAVGAVIVQRSVVVEGLSLVFMKVVDGKLDPKDSYESNWAGNTTQRRDVQLGGTGVPLIGIVGKANAQQKHLTGIGVILDTPEAAKTRKIATLGTPTEIKGGGFDKEFKDAAPDGALLVGLECGLAKFGRNDVLRAFRAVYRVGDKPETLGSQFGTNLTKVVKVVAKPGYAVGAISVKAGLGADGLSITFMKVVDGKLDPKDTYESEWVGGMGGGKVDKLGGDGTPMIGIVGKSNGRDATGLGLLKK
jgi:S1-C subfamily serine protease